MRWKRELERRMVEDPYKMLFGASEERLKGLGIGRGWMELGMGWMEKPAVGHDKVTDSNGMHFASSFPHKLWQGLSYG
jgi:hypothetical protein